MFSSQETSHDEKDNPVHFVIERQLVEGLSNVRGWQLGKLNKDMCVSSKPGILVRLNAKV